MSKVVTMFAATLAAIAAGSAFGDPLVIDHKGYTSLVEDPLRVETGSDIDCRKIGSLITVRPSGARVVQGGKVVEGQDDCKHKGTGKDSDEEDAEPGPDSSGAAEGKSSLPAYQTGPSQVWK